MEKIDLKKELRHLYAPSTNRVEIVDVPQFSFIMFDGRIEPGETPGTSPEFHDALTALYGVSYTLKFMSKRSKSNPIDYTVMALEGLWWTDSGEFDFDRVEEWEWTLMMMQPEHIASEMYQEALRQLRQKRDNPALARLRFETFQEGLCMQITHVGPYAEEPRTIAKMRAFAEENGYRLRGKHHEIYLGDPRRAKPERLKTILRHPLAKDDSPKRS
ncbi:MAG: GyrI-like domain-containing protein [Chloroflexi bacterium]|nr:GyrI-like domain-containing protein [Chloroflexota bacterium]